VRFGEMAEQFINPEAWIGVHERLATIEANQKNQNEKLDKILAQTTKTNGRLSVLEQWKANLKGKIAGITIAVSTIVTAIYYIVSLLIK
jgi:hypothetical protein